MGAGARFMPIAATVGGAAPPGRGLASYRALPVMPAFLPRAPMIGRR
jgi:hypothetical protein